MLRQVQSDRSNLAHGWLPFAADSITAVWHSDAARGPSTPSFNDLLGEREQLRRHVEPKRPGGLEVDDQLEFGRILDWQLSGTRPLEYPADIGADQMIRIGVAGSVAHEAAHRRELAHKVHCRQRVASRQRNELIASADEKRIISNQKRGCSTFDQRCKSRIEIAVGAGPENLEPNSERLRRLLQVFCFGFGTWI